MMKKTAQLLLLIIFPLLGFSQVTEEKARLMLSYLQESKGEEAHQLCNKSLKSQISAAQLSSLWKSLTDYMGAFTGEENAETDEMTRIYTSELVFSSGRFEYKLTVDEKDKVSGLIFIPAKEFSWSPPEYADTTTFYEIHDTIGDFVKLPAVLTLPKTDVLHAVVILVHGSGPHDMDATIGAAKIFKDLAWGLASRGVAVLRYEKRTRVYKELPEVDLVNITAKEETVDDALAAIHWLKTAPGIDTSKIYVAGHSLGGLMAPEIGRLAPELAGLVLLAAPARPLEDILEEQFHYMADSLPGTYTEKQKKTYLKALQKQTALVRSGKFNEKTPPSKLPLGLYPAYWKYLNDYDPLATLEGFPGKILVIQGRKDFQVSMKDYDLWYQQFFLRADFLVTEGDHLLIDRIGKSSPADYETPGHINETIISKIAEFTY